MFEIKIEKISKAANTNSGSFLQTPFWGEFKSRHGWNYNRYSVKVQNHSENKAEVAAALNEVSVLTRSFAHGFFTIAYIPLYPCLPLAQIEADEQGIELCHFMTDFSIALKKVLPKNTICIRFDPAVGFSSPEERDEYDSGLKFICRADRLKIKKNKVDIQPPDTTQICLEGTEDEILERMKSKWRYNIRLASKKGVEVHYYDGKSVNLSEKIDDFYELFKITSERDGIAIHSKDYLTDLITSSSKLIEDGNDVPVVRLYLANHENDILGGIITLFSKTESIYLYGASSNLKRNLMPNFLLQWTAMKDAKAYGSNYYDMYGMPPTDDENHPMHGLYLFKTGFGGNNLHRIGSFDVPLKGIYSLYSFAEKLRAFWHKKVLKKIRGR